MLRNGYVILAGLFFLFRCSDNSDIPNTPTTGKIKVLADNTFQYIVPPQVELFNSIYKNAEVKYQFKSEHECVNDLLNDSCKLILISRALSDMEMQAFKNKNLIIQQTPLAYSGIVLIGKAFKEKGITMDELKKILSGEEEKYPVVFYHKNNGAVLYCKDSLLNGKIFGKNCFVLEDSTAFREYIFTHPGAIGIIDYAYVCDDDSKWIKSLKYNANDTLLIPVRKTKDNPAFYPDQSNIATRDYPLVRTIYCIRRGDDFSLSAGVEAFLAGEKGQVLFKKMGLVPVFDRERRIEMRPY